MEATKPHIAILPSAGMGHLIPLTEFAKTLGLHHNFLVTFIIPSDSSPMKAQKSFLESLPKTINSIFLPPVSLSGLPEDATIAIGIEHSITQSLPALRDTLKLLCGSTRVSALVIDLFGFPAIDVAKELGISSYLFFTCSAMYLSFMLHLPMIDKTLTCEYGDFPESIKLPGCVPLNRKDLTDSAKDRQGQAYKGLLERSKKFNSLDGIMVNSFMEFEPGAFEAFTKEKRFNPPVYPVGPFIQTNSSSSDTGSNSSNCMKWLDEQPPGSVLFVSFGSGGTLTQQQLNELAMGLEMSEQRFLWVVRSPSEKTSNAAYFTVRSKKDPLHFLPEGFLERTKDKGLVVSSWAPQIQVLSHDSTGGFLTHCGWNSTLESIMHGVPLIAWPLYAEQRMNAVVLTEDLRVAMRVKVDENGIVRREQIAMYAKSLIEGDEGKLLKEKMKHFKDAAAKALAKDGSSSKSLSEVAQKLITGV